MMAIMPPPVIAQEIEQIRFRFAGTYQCKAALKPPVHITLIPPFKAQPDIEEWLIPDLEDWSAQHTPFPLVLKDYGNFYRNGVIYIAVAENKKLELFQKELENKFRYSPCYPSVRISGSYHPHITIGYRDIPRPVFPDAAKDYAGRFYNAVFEVDKCYLWKHDTRRWQIQHTFTIGK